MRIRPAERSDLPQIVEVFWQCWTQTYASSGTLQAAMDPDRAGTLWAAALSDRSTTVLVAEAPPPRVSAALPADSRISPADTRTTAADSRISPADSRTTAAESVHRTQTGADGGVLGVVRYQQEGGRWGYVGSLYVAPDAHGRGVGRELLTAAERALADGGAERARLWVFAVNTGAQEFYRRAGWRRGGETRNRDTFGELELGMTKALPGTTQRGRTTHESEQNDEPPTDRPPAAWSTGDGPARGAGTRRGGGDRHARSG